MNHRFKNDLAGRQFGRLTVLEFTGRSNKHKQPLWKCQCNCGNLLDVSRNSLVRGNTKSCGCSRIMTPEKALKYSKPDSALNGVIHSYRKNAKNKNLECSLSNEQFKKFFEKNCFYCGLKPSTVFNSRSHKLVYNGIDRVDSSKGYNEENCVACCTQCNRSKRASTENEFREWIKKVHKHLNNNEKLVSISKKISKNSSIFKHLYSNKVSAAKSRGIKFLIDKDIFKSLISAKCFYCGVAPKSIFRSNNKKHELYYNGLDRIDSELDYSQGNVVTCCSTCNWAKNSYTMAEFRSWVNRVHEFNFS